MDLEITYEATFYWSNKMDSIDSGLKHEKEVIK